MSFDIIIAVVGALAWIPGIYGIIDAVRRRRENLRHTIDEGDRMVVQSAIELLAPYKKRVNELEIQLKDAEDIIHDLSHNLETATVRANTLNEQLIDAQTELSYLRIQVKTLTQQIDAGG